MESNKLVSYVFGFAVGISIAAVGIGLALIGVALFAEPRSAAVLSLMDHPLFRSGSQLVSSGIAAGLLAFAARRLVRRTDCSA